MRSVATCSSASNPTVLYNNDRASSNSYYFDHHGDAPFIAAVGGLELWWRSRQFALDHYQLGGPPG